MREAAIDTYRSAARGAGRSPSAGAPPLDDMLGDGPVSRPAPRGAPRGGITSAAVAAQRLGGGRTGRAAAGRGRGAAGSPGILARLSGRLPRIRPVKALTVGAFGVALVGIVANAMVFQRGHHPSPLFGLGRSVDGAPDAGAQRTAAGGPADASAPTPAAPAPVERTGTIAAAPAAAPAPAAAAAKPAAPVHHAAKAHRDGVEAKGAEASVQAPAAAHPRPGHPAPAHAKAEVKSEAKAEAKGETRRDKSDALGKLIAGSSHPAKADAKPASASHPAKAEAKPEHRPAGEAAQPDHAAKSAEAAPAHPHHRLAAAAPAAPAATAAKAQAE